MRQFLQRLPATPPIDGTFTNHVAIHEGFAAGRVDPDAIITRRFGLDETERALRAGREDPGSVKAMIHL
jgi:threonine dehydrogenase-like Zn-dependent dehydrogenase